MFFCVNLGHCHYMVKLIIIHEHFHKPVPTPKHDFMFRIESQSCCGESLYDVAHHLQAAWLNVRWLDNWSWEDVISTSGYLSRKRVGAWPFVNISVEKNGNYADIMLNYGTASHCGSPICMVMHGQYGLLHAPSISACGIAWGLHCKQNRIYICKTNFSSLFSFLCTCT